MPPCLPSELLLLCEEAGLVPDYVDGAGNARRAPLESIYAVLTALDIEGAERDPRAARRALLHERWSQGLPPVLVAWDGRLESFTFAALALAPPSRLTVTITLEAGSTLNAPAFLESSTPAAADPQLCSCRYRVGLDLPHGYHELTLEHASSSGSALVISAPSILPRPAHGFGLFAPVYALRGATRQGVGTTSELKQLCIWAGHRGASFVAILPVLAAYLSQPYDSSPFSPASRLFWNEALLDLAALDEHDAPDVRAALAQAEPELARLESLSYASFRGRMAAMTPVLDAAASNWLANGGCTARETERYREAAPELERYAAFRAWVEACGVPAGWSEHERGRARAGVPPQPAPMQRHLYAQLRMDQQLAQARETAQAHGVSLYMDLPLGTSPEGFDAFIAPHCFLRGLAAGAPPDAFAPHGQLWGISPLSPWGQQRDRLRLFARTLRTHFRHARMLRLDHVMSLHRIFCAPLGARASDGLYVQQPAQELYAVLCLEAQRAGAACIGEDLGVVPDEVRDAMRRHGLLRMAILLFEADWLREHGPRHSFAGALAAASSHDLPSLASALLDPELGPKLRTAVGVPAGSTLPAARNAVLENLGASAATLVQVALEDLWGETRPVNVPGTFDPEHNFCRRMTRTLEEIEADPALHEQLAVLRSERARSREP